MESLSSGDTIVFLVGHSVVPFDLYSKATQQRFGCCSACTWFVAFSQPRFSFGSPLVCTAAATNNYKFKPQQLPPLHSGYLGLKFVRAFALQIARENHDAIAAMDQADEELRIKRERAADAAAASAFAKVKPILTTTTTTNTTTTATASTTASTTAPMKDGTNSKAASPLSSGTSGQPLTVAATASV